MNFSIVTQNEPKRHSDSKRRQQRINRRIERGKPFQRGQANDPPKDLIKVIAMKIFLDIQGAHPEFPR